MQRTTWRDIVGGTGEAKSWTENRKTQVNVSVSVLRGEYAERRKKYDIIFRFSLKTEYNIVLNGISLNILGNMIIYSVWASPRNIHIRIPHVGSLSISVSLVLSHSLYPSIPLSLSLYIYIYIYTYIAAGRAARGPCSGPRGGTLWVARERHLGLTLTWGLTR